MIQNLIQQITTLLQESLAGVISDPEQHIVASPATEPTAEDIPLIALYPNKLEIRQDFQEKSSSQPRPQELREEIAVNASNPSGPYSLAKTPLNQSTLCQIIFDQGMVTERQVTLVENKDFEINYQNATILFSFDLSEASSIMLQYSFVGIFTIREFQQEFLVDIYDANLADVEKWSSLVTGIILTNHDELIEDYNLTEKTEYIANQFITTHTIDQIQILEGVPDNLESIVKLQLKFQATGQLKLVKEIVGGFGLIEKIQVVHHRSVG